MVSQQAFRAKVRAVVCDLDGVIRHWPEDGQARVERDHGLPLGAVFAALTWPDLLDDAVTGRTSDAEWRRRAAHRLATANGLPVTQVEAAVAEWSREVGILDSEVVGALQLLRHTGIPVVVLTNATDRLDADLAALGLQDHVDAVVNSAVVGHAKPSAGAYEAAHATVERLVGGPVGRADVLFIDDTPGHVDAARAHGWTAVLFRDVTDVPLPH